MLNCKVWVSNVFFTLLFIFGFVFLTDFDELFSKNLIFVVLVDKIGENEKFEVVLKYVESVIG